MIKGIPKISVLIICYKQEELIKRAIDSLLSQKEYIYEICVSDDCSPDRTWEVLQEYDRQYPGLFKLHQNQPNVGIFENIEYTWTMPSGDIIYQLSGDDECGEGWFKTVIEYIQNNNINYKEELFCIYGDYKAVYPNGDSFILKNDIINSGYNSLGLAIRKLICNRSACYSRKVLDRFVKVSDGRSYAVESAQDMQLQIMSEKNYYIPCVGNIYYTRIGVSVGNNRNGSIETKAPMEYVNEIILSMNYELPSKDLILLKYYINRFYNKKRYNDGELSYISFQVRKYILKFQKIRIREINLGLRAFRIKRYLFAIIRRIPHNKPIHWTI